MRRVIAVGSTVHRNRLGRVFSLWLTARAAEMEFRYFGVDDGSVWEPLRTHTAFLSDLETGRDLAEVERKVTAAIGPESTVLICKPRPELLKIGRSLQGSVPVIVDVDDPELVEPWGDTTTIQRAKRIVKFGPAQYRFGWARRVVRTMPVITSNPSLQEVYGGEVVPHVREPTPAPPERPTLAEPFTIAFVGTIREHKGIREVRTAAAALARERDVVLRITAPAPPDAEPWEDWLGATTLEAGRKVLEGAHAVPIVSRAGAWGDRQLPVKLIDAMASGVPAIITPRPPLIWATAGSSVVVRDSCVEDLTAALRLLADDSDLAAVLGRAAWRRAGAEFSPAAAAPQLVKALQLAREAANSRCSSSRR